MAYVHKSQHIPPDNMVVNMHYLRNWDNHLIDMLNLGYIIDCHTMNIIKRDSFVPRAYIVHQMVVKEDEETLDYMMSNQFDPLTMVVLNSKPNILTSRGVAGVAKKCQETCQILAYRHDEIIVKAALNRPGLLVMSEIDYPGWQAFVNGQRKKILRGNYLFRTVPLEAGEHTVHFVFKPFSFKIGSTVSGISLSVVAIGLLILCRKPKHQSSFNHLGKE